MNHSQRSTSYVSAALVFLLLAAPVLGTSPLASAVKQQGRRSDVVYPPAGFEFTKKDDEQVEMFQAQFTLRLHGILISNYYEVLQTAVQDWGTAIDVYKTMARDSQILELASRSQPAGDFFSASHVYFERKATLCSEVSREKLSPYLAQGFFNTLVRQATGFYFPKVDLQTFRKWSQRSTDIELEFGRHLEVAKNQWSARYHTDFLTVHHDLATDVPFDLPFKSHDERNYIYVALLADSNVPNELQLWYHVDFLNVAAKSWEAIGSATAEIALFSGSQINDARRIGFASAFLDALFDCATEKLKSVREKQYVEIRDFHDAIRNRILAHRELLDELLNREDFKELLATPLTPVYAKAIANLRNKTKEYIRERELIAEYAHKLANFSSLALQKFRRAGRTSMDQDIVAAYEKFKALFTAKNPRGLEGPCTAAKRVTDLLANPGIGTSDDIGTDKAPPHGPGRSAEDKVEEYQLDVANLSKSGLSVNPGDTVSIAAAGVISVGFFAGNSTPDGIDGFSEYSYLPEFKHGSLLVRISATQNGGWKFCGSRCTTQTPIRGNLEFLVNDRDYSNNTGNYHVRITISRARSGRK